MWNLIGHKWVYLWNKNKLTDIENRLMIARAGRRVWEGMDREFGISRCKGAPEAQSVVCLQCGRPGFDLWVGKIPWKRKWQPTPVFLPGESHGWRSLAGYSPGGCTESDTSERLHFHFLLLYIEWINNRVLLYSRGNGIQYPIINIMEKNIKIIDAYNRITLLYSRDWHNIVNQLYFNKMKKESIVKVSESFCVGFWT